jgi:hypothetical protein
MHFKHLLTREACCQKACEEKIKLHVDATTEGSQSRMRATTIYCNRNWRGATKSFMLSKVVGLYSAKRLTR